MHGDLHHGNFLIDKENNNKITLFDWDATSRAPQAIDLGTMMFGRHCIPLFMGKSDVKEQQVSSKEYAHALMDGYGDSITLEQVGKGATWRQHFMMIIMKILCDTSTNDGIMAYFKSLKKWEADGMFDFTFLN